MVYRAFGDTLRMNLAGSSLEFWLGMEGKHVTFLELWLRMTSLKLWLGIEDEHRTFLELWLRIVSVTSVSVQFVAHMEGLHSIE